MKIDKRSIARKGTVYLIPLANGVFAGGLVTHSAQKSVVRFSVYPKKRFSSDASVEEIMQSIEHDPIVFKTFHGVLGFTLDGWSVVGTSSVPETFEKLPFFRSPGRVYRINELDLLREEPTGPVSLSDEIIDYGASGHGFIQNVLRDIIVNEEESPFQLDNQ